MLHTRHPRQTITAAILFVSISMIAACDTVLGIEPGVTLCDGKTAGTRLPPQNQVPGDCQEIVCGDNGNTEVRLADDADDDNPCTIDTCIGTEPQHAWQTQYHCYDGPSGTEDVGICLGGIRQCDPATKGPIGPCAGQVLPQLENCRNNVDDDCDGKKDQTDDGCICGDGIADATNNEECDDGGIESGPDNTCSSQCTLLSCSGGGSVFLAIDQFFLGDVDPDGIADFMNGWRNYGFNLDGLISTKTSTDLCKPPSGGNTAQSYPDGPNGIDNSFGKNVLPILLGLASDLSNVINDEIAKGNWTLIYTMAGSQPTPCSTSSAFLLGSKLGTSPTFDGNDIWPVDPTSVTGPHYFPYVNEAKYRFDKTNLINNRITTKPMAQLDLALNLSGFRLTLPIRNARLEFQLSADRKSATSGILGGVILTEDFINETRTMVAASDTSFCDPTSPTLVSILNQFRQASDIMIDGTQNSNAECDGISIGLGFTMKAVQVGNIGDSIKPPPDPCLPAPLCTNGSCPAPSCGNSPAPQTCGPSGNENCCISQFVPGGTYNRSNDVNYPASVSDFYLDRFETTVGRFRKFVEAYPGSKPIAGAGAHSKIPGSGWDASWDADLPTDKAALMSALKCHPSNATWTDTPASNENLPINCVNWYTAVAFCAWDGGRLPTEAEWNYAAAGGSEQWPFPWGFAGLDGNHAVFGCQGDGQCTLGDILHVGSKSPIGDGRWGQSDLSGSMWEWTLDLSQSPYFNPCIDCAILQNGSDRVTRGGDWSNNEIAFFGTQYRWTAVSSGRTTFFGLRCARNP